MEGGDERAVLLRGRGEDAGKQWAGIKSVDWCMERMKKADCSR